MAGAGASGFYGGGDGGSAVVAKGGLAALGCNGRDAVDGGRVGGMAGEGEPVQTGRAGMKKPAHSGLTLLCRPAS